METRAHETENQSTGFYERDEIGADETSFSHSAYRRVLSNETHICSLFLTIHIAIYV